MIPRRSAASRFARPRPTPTMRSTAAALRSASAHEPPIKPTPTTTNFLMWPPTLAAAAAALPPEGEQFAPWGGPAALMCALIRVMRRLLQRDRERSEKALVFRGQTNGDAEPLR